MIAAIEAPQGLINNFGAPREVGNIRISPNSGREKKKVKSLSHVRLFETPWTVAYQGSSVHGIFQARILAVKKKKRILAERSRPNKNTYTPTSTCPYPYTHTHRPLRIEECYSFILGQVVESKQVT